MNGYVTDAEYNAAQREDLNKWQKDVQAKMQEKKCCLYTLAKGTGLHRANLKRVIFEGQYPTLSTMSKIHLFLTRYEK
jgi:DNA-binding phage protein